MGLSLSELEKIRNCLEKCPKVEKAILYGSRAKGNFKPGSDIDLTVLAPTMNLSELFALEAALDDLMLPYKIDLSLFHQIENEDLIDHIQRVGKDFYVRS